MYSPRCRLFAGFPLRFFFAITLMVAPCASGQADPPLSGIVADQGGQPIAGVSVVGSPAKTCCPVKPEQTTTDDRGVFHLNQPGAVVHFYQDGYGPLTYVVKPGTSEVHLTLDSTSSKLFAPACHAPAQGQKRIGWGEYGVHFSAPAKEVTIKGGKPDTDYVRYVLKPKKGDSWLEIWYGPYALTTTPDDDYFVNSLDFSQSYIEAEQGKAYGVDSWGHRSDGTRWRWTAVLLEGGARYETKNEADARIFDRIIDSICISPYPSN